MPSEKVPITCGQPKPRSDCASAQSDQGLSCPSLYTTFPVYCKRKMKILVTSRECTSSSGFSTFRYDVYEVNQISYECRVSVNSLILFLVWYRNCNLRKLIYWYVRPTKTQISLRIRAVWLESSLSAWRNYILGYPKCAQWRFWSDCTNAQTNLNLHWAHISKGTFSDVAILIHVYLFWDAKSFFYY